MHDDDQPIGRILTRRELLALVGGAGAALLVGRSFLTSRAQSDLPACVVRPELAAGPFFVDEMLERVDIRVDPADESIKPGTPLLLTVNALDVTGGACAALAGAQVDLWQCDADGVYSGVRDARNDTRGESWLRGHQITDEEGRAEFLTIVPGWYPGRALHIHFKIRTEDGYDFASQFFFDPDQMAPIMAEAPYRGTPDTPNSRDFIFRRSRDLLTLDVTAIEDDDPLLETHALDAGYQATFDIGLDLG